MTVVEPPGETSLDIPWKVRTQQSKGFQSERDEARKRGARLHPGSGSGHIKHDASNDQTLFEMKLAGKTHALNGEYLAKFYTEAAIQDKDAVYVVVFDNGMVLEGTVTKQ